MDPNDMIAMEAIKQIEIAMEAMKEAMKKVRSMTLDMTRAKTLDRLDIKIGMLCGMAEEFSGLSQKVNKTWHCAVAREVFAEKKE